MPWLACLVFYPLPWLWWPPTPFAMVASAAGLALFLPLYVLGFRQPPARLLAAAAGVFAIGPALASLGGNWTVFSIYAATMAGHVQPPRRAADSIATMAVLTAGVGLILGQPPLWWVPGIVLMGVAGGATSSRETLRQRNETLLATQSQVRRVAGIAERERIARDLHDLLGRTLTLTALKADLAVKLSEQDVEAAKREMRGVATAAREALAEVRAALSGMNGAGLVQEVAASTAALKSAGIAVQVEGDAAAVPVDTGAVLAMALREAVTNVIRHSGAHRCKIAIGCAADTVRLGVVDDGVGGPIREGLGLKGMRDRLVAAGGALVITSDPSTRGTGVVATVPLDGHR